MKKYDGCSGGMSKLWRWFGSVPPWEHCCDEHDQPYAKGGTEIERFCADMRLYFCVLESGHPKIAQVMFILVRYGGVPWLPTPYRWGFETNKWRYDKSKNASMIEILEGQLRVVDEVNTELNVIGMTGSIAWKAQMLRLKSQRNDIFDEAVDAIEEYLSEHINEPYAHRSGVNGSITAVKNRMKHPADNSEDGEK